MSRFFRPQPLSPSKLLVGSEIQTRLYKSAGSPEPSLITFVISTSPHGFIMLGSDLKKKRKDTWALGRSSPCRTHAGIRSCIAKKFYIFVIFRGGGGGGGGAPHNARIWFKKREKIHGHWVEVLHVAHTRGSGLVLLRSSIFLWFLGGGGGGGEGTPVPPLWIRAWDQPMYTLIEIFWNPILSCASAFVRHYAYFLSHAQFFRMTKHSWSGSKPFLQM